MTTDKAKNGFMEESTSPKFTSNNKQTWTSPSPEKSLAKEYQIYQPGSIPIPVIDQWFTVRDKCHLWARQHTIALYSTLLFLFFVLYAVFLGFAINHNFDKAVAVLVLGIVLLFIAIYSVLLYKAEPSINQGICIPLGNIVERFIWTNRWIFGPLIFIGIGIYIIFVIIEEKEQLQAALGLFIFSFIPLLTSKHPDNIAWRPVLMGVALQFGMGILILRWRTGYEVVKFIGDNSVTFLEYSLSGASQLFGNPWFFLHPFPFLVVPLVAFIGGWVYIFTHYGLTDSFVRKFGWLMTVSMGTTAVESVSLVVNFFLSVLDCLLLFKNYIPLLTPSEFFTFLVGAHSSIAGFAFLLFIWFGASPQHLLTASVMSAPAAVAMSKLNYPETEESMFKTSLEKEKLGSKYPTVLHALSAGVIQATKGTISLMIQALAFVAMVEFVDDTIGWFGDKVDVEVSIRIIFGKMLSPLAWLMGVPWAECETVGSLLGMKIFVNEILAFLDLGTLLSNGELSPRAAAIAQYGMCGFSSFGTLYMFVGVWRSFYPKKLNQAVGLIPRILLCTNLACFMTASIAGIFYDEEKLASVDPPTSSGFVLILMTTLPGISELMNLL